MYQKIVVPLDGSKLAESVFPFVEELAKGCKTEEVVLVSVTERVAGQTAAPEIRELQQASPIADISRYPEAIGGTDRSKTMTKVPVAVGKKERQAERYLGRIARRLMARGLTVQAEVLVGNPAEEIVSFANAAGANLIVMASHGRSGPSRWAYGSVADKVFRASCVPILMVRAPGCFPGL